MGSLVLERVTRVYNVMVVDPLLTVVTARRVPRVNNTDEGQKARAIQHWTGALKHRLSVRY